MGSLERHDGQADFGAAEDPGVLASNRSPNDTAAFRTDHFDLLEFIDALADFAAELLAEGRLDGLTNHPEPGKDVEPKISFTSASLPSIK